MDLFGLGSAWSNFRQNWADSNVVSALKYKAAKDPVGALDEASRGLQWGEPTETVKQAYIDTLKALAPSHPQKALHGIREAIQGRRESDPAVRAQLISILAEAVKAPEQAAIAVTEAGALLYAVKDLAPEQRTSLLDVLAAGARNAPEDTMQHAGQTFGSQASSALTAEDTSKLVAIIKDASANKVVEAVRPASKAFFSVHKRDADRAVVLEIFGNAAGQTAIAAEEAGGLLLSTPGLTDTERNELMGVVRKGLNSEDSAVRQAVAEAVVHRIQSDYSYYVAQQGWQPFAREQASVVGIPLLAQAFREAADAGKVNVAALQDYTRKFLRSTAQVGAAFTALSAGLDIPATRAPTPTAPKPS